MFYSMGNWGKTAMLFIDLGHPRRLRLHGTAGISDDGAFLSGDPEALMVVRAELATIFSNCPRYIHKHQRLERSEFVPKAGTETPLPEWKHVDYLQEKLPEKEREKARKLSDTIAEGSRIENVVNR